MADPQFSARSRASAGAPTSGVIHVRTRLTADFTVLSNALVQRRGSAVTIGVAAYIQSLPDGSPVTIAALCAHFDEGEILISRALRELEDAGYLERRRERTAGGHIRTRTYFYDVPGGHLDTPDPDPEPDPPAKAPAPAPEPEPPAKAPAPADPRALAVLGSLRRYDSRLILTVAEADRLAPHVARWLAAGVGPGQLTELLTADLPDRFRTRPVGVLTYRLRETPLPAPPPPARDPSSGRPAVVPLRNCDGCERAFRSDEHQHCRECREHRHRAATTSAA
ncbi:hypothetical protein [Streptomyces beihaiensis]|uniref:Helix-turn-helix domain-containing protein n=1 Tax=Streptomyces beihaiensis TaxID=2984495 RepID=A0ABT3TWD0_9ACTN|nr:hypothetical protein [Streptomyces beihaiensis]MCX3060796.1 hypothetical protein [Streptomyces beihaiensis]